ncbi:MAG TPA: thiamine phosphate synthase [Myxococcota bacterium]|nr:thiamine phosphate synthase [Myxococcota bacterium]
MIPRLCYWTDGARGSAGRDPVGLIERLARGGVEAIVLREKDWSAAHVRDCARRVEKLRADGLRVLVSRRLDLARALALDGVQLGAESVSVREARAFLGPQALVGYSAHDVDEAREAAAQGASYVTLSPIFATGSKPEAAPRGLAWLRAAARALPVPVLALGGVTAERVAELRRAGAHGVVAISALGAAPDPERAAREFQRALADEKGT